MAGSPVHRYTAPEVDEPDDDLLLQRWRDGDLASGNFLFDRHFDSVRRFFRNKAWANDVEDLIQRTFAACVEARDRFRGDSSFRTFLFAVARNQLHKYLRDRASQDNRIDPDLGVSSVQALGMSPSSAVSAREKHALLLDALQKIPVEQQVMLELFYWEQLPGPEIAKVFEISPTTVRTRLFRARQSLETVLKSVSGQAPPTDLDATARASGKGL
jgi:RNA polymerase sigma-70 factor (ECF subfamily)